MFRPFRWGFPVSRARRRKFGRRLQVEGLEIRSMLSLTAINFGATVTTRSAPVAIGGEVFFTATESTHGNQVWETDGTAAGTVRLSDGHDVNGVNGGIFPSDLTVVGNEVFFSATDFSHGYQIWETNGTAAGTQMVSDIDPGTTASSPPTSPPSATRSTSSATTRPTACSSSRAMARPPAPRWSPTSRAAKGYPGCLPHRPDRRRRPAVLLGHRLDARDAVVVGQPVRPAP